MSNAEPAGQEHVKSITRELGRNGNLGNELAFLAQPERPPGKIEHSVRAARPTRDEVRLPGESTSNFRGRVGTPPRTRTRNPLIKSQWTNGLTSLILRGIMSNCASCNPLVSLSIRLGLILLATGVMIGS